MKAIFRNTFVLILLTSIVLVFLSCEKDNGETEIMSYEIGQKYGGGVIFYIDETGQHGLIALEFDIGDNQYGCGDSREPTAQNMEIGTGRINTLAMVESCDEESFAALDCYQLEVNGYDDWFLPSIDELELAYINRDLIGNFKTEKYYVYSSSSEAPPIRYGDTLFYNRSWVYDFGDEPLIGERKLLSGKTNYFSIRPIRAF